MPIYEYSHPETGEVIELVQKMSENHVHVDKDGVEWRRVFNVPNAAIDTAHHVNPESKSDFLKATEKSRNDGWRHDGPI